MALKSEYAGVWQDAEGTQTSTGILEINKQGLKLKLIGIHGIKEDEGREISEGILSGTKIKQYDPFSELSHISRLFSKTVEGSCVSLFGLSLSHSHSTIFASLDEKYFEFKAKYGLFGDRCILTESEKLFFRSRYHIADLHRFSTGSRFNIEHDENYKNEKIHILDDGESDVFEVPEKEICLKFYNGYSINNDLYSIRLGFLTNLTIESKENTDFSTHLAHYSRFNLLLEFLRGHKTVTNNIFFYTDHVERQFGDTKIYEEFEFISNKGYYPIDVPDKDELIISLNTLQNRADIVHSWMVREDSIIRLVSWFNYLWQNESYLVESQLVEYASLLEIMSISNERAGKFLPREDFNAILGNLKRSIPDDLPNDVRKIFLSYLERMNNKSQRLAVNSLISEIWGYFADYTDFECSEFAKAISVNRNNISHGNFIASNSCTARTVTALYYLKEYSKYMAYTLLARAIGISEADVNRTIVEEFRQRRYKGMLKRSDFY